MARVHLFTSSPYNEKRVNRPSQTVIEESIGDEPAAPKTIEENKTIENTELTAALLQPTTATNPATTTTTTTTTPPTEDVDTLDKSEDVLDQAAAATALQLLGLSNASKEDSIMDKVKAPGMSYTPSNDDVDLEDNPFDYKRGTWTKEEDELLLSGIKRFGYGRWKEIAINIPGRKGKQLKQRWDNTLAAKYVDQEWLKKKIKIATEQPREDRDEKDEKALKFLETTDWNDVALKISEKARQGDQGAIEALLSQALLGTVSNPNNPPHHSSQNIHEQQQQQQQPPHQQQQTSPPHSSQQTPASDTNLQTEPNALQHTSTNSNTTTNSASAVVNTNTNQPPGHSSLSNYPSPSGTTPLNFADAALALYTQHLAAQQQNNNGNPNGSPSSNQAILSHPYFMTNPFTSDNGNVAAAAAAAAAAVAAVAHQNSQQQSQSAGSSARSHLKRRRSDPALADTQSAAMSIYASATPITTTVNNLTQTVYPCLFPSCGKTFARLYNLKSHSRTHTDDRPFICPACTAAFSRNHDLKRHSKIHGGDKPYQCHGCKKSFSR